MQEFKQLFKILILSLFILFSLERNAFAEALKEETYFRELNEFILDQHFSVPSIFLDLSEPIEQENMFTIEMGALTMSQFDFAHFMPFLNFKLLYPTKRKNKSWVYFLEYSLGFENGPLPTITGTVDQFIHFLFLGTRYYFDLDWPVNPYAHFSIGLMGYHAGNQLNNFLLVPMPIIAGGIGTDVMLTPQIGLNAEISIPIIFLQLKLGLKFII